MSPEEMICFDVYSANLAFGRVYKPLLEPLGVTYPQYLVLLILWRRDRITVGEIGAELGLDTNTLTPLIKRLEAAGYVNRARDPQDERKVRVRLTPEGRQLEETARHIPQCIADATGLSVADLNGIQAMLRRLHSGLAKAAA